MLFRAHTQRLNDRVYGITLWLIYGGVPSVKLRFIPCLKPEADTNFANYFWRNRQSTRRPSTNGGVGKAGPASGGPRTHPRGGKMWSVSWRTGLEVDSIGEADVEPRWT